MSLDPITLAVANSYTDKKIKEAQLGGDVDLSGLATTEFVENKIAEAFNQLPIAELSEF